MITVEVGKLPVDALTVENTIRNHCQHYGYPGAQLVLDGDTLKLVLTQVEPLTPHA